MQSRGNHIADVPFTGGSEFGPPKAGGAGGLSVPYDFPLLFSVLFLVGIGVVMVYSASSVRALERYGTDFYFLKKQAVFSMMGIVALVIFRRLPFKIYRVLAYPVLGISLMLLVGVLIPGLKVAGNGASRWISLGGLTFQPSEVARFGMVIYLAYSLSKKQDRLKVFSIGIVPHVAVLGGFILLIAFQPDFGSMVILTAVTWVMLFAGGVRLMHLLSPLVVVLPALYLYMISAPYRIQRLTGFLDPWNHQSDAAYQVIHSLMAFGSGGVLGAGIGNSYQKLFYLPESHTDFIFAVVGEELGLVGVMVILAFYGIILWRGIQIARQTRDTFGQLLAVGLTTAIGLQVLVNMSVVLGLLPAKGLTLPFMSYGGTSLLINMASVGILLNIAASMGEP